MECLHLAPNAQVSLYPWKDTLEKIPLAVRHIRTFLRAHRPAIPARQPLAAAAQEITALVIPGLPPGIHVDGRNKSRHD